MVVCLVGLDVASATVEHEALVLIPSLDEVIIGVSVRKLQVANRSL